MQQTFNPGSFQDVLFRSDPGEPSKKEGDGEEEKDEKVQMFIFEPAIRLSKRVKKAFSVKIKERGALRQRQQRASMRRRAFSARRAVSHQPIRKHVSFCDDHVVLDTAV